MEMNPVLFVGGYALATIFFVPGAPFTLAAGALYGPVRGAAVALVGATLGATGAFLLGRTALRERIRAAIVRRPVLSAIEAAVSNEGWRVAALLRLSPVVPFNLLNYALGLTRIGLWTYLWTTILFMTPGAFLYSYVGAVGREAATGAGTARWGLHAAGLAATVLATWLIARSARRTLAASLRRAGGGPPLGGVA